MSIASKSSAEQDIPHPQSGSSSADSPAETPGEIQGLMSRIRKQVRSEVVRCGSTRGGFETIRPNFRKKKKAGEILHSEELQLLNQQYIYPSGLSPQAIQSHRPGVIGKVILRLKRKFVEFLRNGIFHDYLQREQQFQETLVRHLNAQAKYIDERDASNFWELVHKVDTDLSKAIDRVERLNDEYIATSHTTERALHDVLHRELTQMTSHITELQGTAAKSSQKLQTLESVTFGLEAIMTRFGNRSPNTELIDTGAKETSKVSEGVEFQEVADQSYLLLENRFRGSEEAIQQHLRQYLPVLEGLPGPVFEVGAGRGELLSLLSEGKISASGVDIDQAMVDAATERGVSVSFGDGISMLGQKEDRKLGAVIAIQVVEHLERQQLDRFIQNSFQKLAPGGKVVFETINPTSMLALSSNYFRDPTHVFPQHPDTLAYRLSCAGFENVRVEYCSPVPDQAQLQAVPITASMTPQWQLSVERMNQNIERLNSLLYGYQDFFVVGEVPGG